MKKTKLLIMLLFGSALFITACCKKPKESATLIRDCTGTYLRVNGKDYQVCNIEKVNDFSDGASVHASYNVISECNGSAKDQYTCQPLRASDGWVEIIRIN